MAELIRVLVLASWTTLAGVRADDVVHPRSLIPAADPTSELVELPAHGLNAAFCAKWNPDFSFKENQCCARTSWRYRRRGIKCTPSRAKMSYCDEMTDAQRRYEADVRAGRYPDVLALISWEVGRLDQAQCSPHDGFLAWGRPVVETAGNRLRLRRPDRCVHFGTDAMVGLLEWLGRQVGTRFAGDEYRGVRVLVGDVSAPRGGCLYGRGGRKGHASHTSGLDVDLGFLHAAPGAVSPAVFSRRGFEPELNWWFVKQIFANPYACVRSIYLDRRHLARLARAAGGDPDWNRLGRLIRHIPGHQNHFHVRIGEAPGAPGCGEDDLPLRAERPSETPIKAVAGSPPDVGS